MTIGFRLRNRLVVAAAAVGLALVPYGGGARADIANWPVDDSGWNAITLGGDFYPDPVGDINPDWLDIVGDTSTFGAGYWAFSNAGTPVDETDDEIMWRIRLEEWKTNPNVVWQIFMDVDGDDLIDYSAQVDESGGNVVELVAATTGGTTWGDVSLDTTALWSDTISGFSRVTTPTGDGSAFGGGGDDAFLDFGMPWLAFSSLTGVNSATPVRFGLSTSASHVAINKDLPLSASASDPVAAGFGDAILGIPEPSTVTLLAGGLVALALIARRSPGG